MKIKSVITIIIGLILSFIGGHYFFSSFCGIGGLVAVGAYSHNCPNITEFSVMGGFVLMTLGVGFFILGCIDANRKIKTSKNNPSLTQK